MAKMRAKMRVESVQNHGVTESLRLQAVCPPKFNEDGTSEDNTFARYTPYAQLDMGITNPALVGTFKPGQVFYVDFTEVE